MEQQKMEKLKRATRRRATEIFSFSRLPEKSVARWSFPLDATTTIRSRLPEKSVARSFPLDVTTNIRPRLPEKSVARSFPLDVTTEKRSRLPEKSVARSFPLDVTTEILSRLPEKSVVRFRCVSKLWSSITTDPYFINLFESRSPRPKLLLCIRKDDNMIVASIPQHTDHKSYSSSQPLFRYHMKFPASDMFMPPTESVHGLICFQDSATLVVLNPSKGQFLALPTPSKSWSAITVLLGYDPIEGKHKVVCMPYGTSGDACRVLTLGSPQESWRTVEINQKHLTRGRTSGRCINGVVYYLASNYRRFIMTFDVRSEKFGMIRSLWHIRTPKLITYEGRLACIDMKYTLEDQRITLWVLEDAEKHMWSGRNIRAPLYAFDERLKTLFSLEGVTNAGELIYPSFFCKSGYVLFCDPVRNSFRKFELKGIVDDECGLNQGVQNLLMDKTYYLHAFPNHIGCQMSL